jgi:K+-transporting ATPase ATPase A chain
MTLFFTQRGADLTEIFFLGVLLFVACPFMGLVMSKLVKGEWPSALLSFESKVMHLFKIDGHREMERSEYLKNFLWLHFWGFVFLMVLLAGLDGVPWLLALNIALSFLTNTNWQAYQGESLLSGWSETLGLTVQNFVSPAMGLCVLLVLARSLRRSRSKNLGNIWQDFFRVTLWILLPLSLVTSLVLISQGVPQTFPETKIVESLEGDTETFVTGPVASQVAIKQVGSNGGGYYGANSAHPLENPSPLSNFIQLIMILFLPISCLFCFGFLIKDFRHAWALFGACSLLFLVGLAFTVWAQWSLNESFGMAWLEGREFRFRDGMTSLWSVATTATSHGSVNSSLSTASPFAITVWLFMMLSGEVIFGGIGSGLVGLILYVILAVFLAGLMVGRTPEYLGKKITTPELVATGLGLMIPALSVLILSALAATTSWGLEARSHLGPHGLTEILYAVASSVGNNGSALAGLNAASPFYLLLTSVGFVLGRFGLLIPVFFLAGLWVEKPKTPWSEGTFPTHGFTFALLVVMTIVLVGALTFFPLLSLGPVLDGLSIPQVGVRP